MPLVKNKLNNTIDSEKVLFPEINVLYVYLDYPERLRPIAKRPAHIHGALNNQVQA